MAASTTPQLTWTNIVSTIAVVLTMFAGAWMLFQGQFTSMEKQFSSADGFQSTQINNLRAELEYHKNNSVLRSEHIEFVKRLDGALLNIAEQLKIIETTRPTTGELQNIGTGVKEQLQEIKERVRSLEDNLRRPQALAPVTPPAPLPGQR